MRARVLFSPEPARGWIPWSPLAPLLCVVFVATPILALSGLLERLHLRNDLGAPTDSMGLLALLLLPFPCVGLVVLAWVRLVERRPLATIGLAGAGARPFLRGLAIGIVTAFAVVAAIWAVGAVDERGYARALASPDALLAIGLLLLGFVVQASVEEVLFRGWLLSALARKVPLAIAVALSSLVFMFLHYAPQQHPVVTINMFLFAAFTCAWAIRAEHIWGAMGWHAGWNWLLATGFELPVTGIDARLPALLVKLTPTGPVHWTGGAQGPEGSVFCGLFFVCGIAWLVWRPAPRGPTSA
jgi:membrane protease YdiL (CAAX protease family)